MKALTIKEPWASLIINGYKDFEFRSWKTNYRGKVLIHAGKSFDEVNRDRFKDLNLSYSKGEIIGETEIVDCQLVTEEFYNKYLKYNPLVYCKSRVIGEYAFVLNNTNKYKEKIPYKGKLSFWEYNE